MTKRERAGGILRHFRGATPGQTFVIDANGEEVLVPAFSGAGRWEPVTNGDAVNPEIIFYNGDVEMYFVAD